MRDKLYALNREYDMLPPGATVLCAVSGGADSMCLLHLLHTMAPEMGISLRCAHFNHNLRGEESLRDEEFVRARCLEWGIPFTCGGGDVSAQAEKNGRGIEETAREMRYAFLEQTANKVGAARIATAHTANDNAETMLLHMVRGAGLQGLTGIPPRRGSLVRPLLTVTRAEIEEYCRHNNVPYVKDSSNEDDGYTRNFLRHRVMPLLEQVNPRVAETMSAAAGRLREDHEWLNAEAVQIAARAEWNGGELTVEVGEIASLPDALASRVVRQWMERAGGGRNCAAAHIHAILKLCRASDPSGEVHVPGLTVRRVYNKVVFASPGREMSPPPPTPVQEDGRTVYGDTGWTIHCRPTVCPETGPKNPDSFFLARDKINGTPVLRPRRTGDSIKLPGRGTKTVKKLLIDEKVPLAHRDLLPVLADDVGVLALAAFGPDKSHLAQPGESALMITLEKERST